MILDAEGTEHPTGKVGTTEMAETVIQGIGPIDREQAHGTAPQSAACPITEERSRKFQLLQGEQWHSETGVKGELGGEGYSNGFSGSSLA